MRTIGQMLGKEPPKIIVKKVRGSRFATLEIQKMAKRGYRLDNQSSSTLGKHVLTFVRD